MKNKIRQIQSEKAKLNRELEQHETMLAEALNAIAALGDEPKGSVPGMSKPQAEAAINCLVAAKNLQIEAARNQIKQIRQKMADLTIEADRLGRA
jgi:predicted  nucleic acid-binding Zn-ribbon protein